MKLYNKTRYPGSLLESVIAEAGKAVGARTSGVIVKVTSTKQGNTACRGTAWRADYVYKYALETRQRTQTGDLKRGIVDTDNGFIELVLPYPFIPDYVLRSSDTIRQAWIESRVFDGLSLAERIYSVAAHEWQHVKQYQHNAYNFRDKRERAKNHDNRIWERDAIKASSKATDKPRDTSQQAILDLALWLEDNKAQKQTKITR